MVSTHFQGTFSYPASPICPPGLSCWLSLPNTLVFELGFGSYNSFRYLNHPYFFLALPSSPRGDRPALRAVTAAGRSLRALTATLQAGSHTRVGTQ